MCRLLIIFYWLLIVVLALSLNLMPRAKKPAELEGKNWRDLRKKQRLGHDEWQPQKRLTHDQMEHLRNLKRMQPHEWTNKKLADKFGISIQSVARILKSKFDAPPEVRARQDAKADQQRDERRERFYEKLKRTHKTCTNFANVDLK